MRNTPSISSPKNLKQWIALTVVCSFLFTSVIGIHTTLAVQKSESDLLAQANNALTAAQAALDNAEAKEQEGNARLSELQEFSTLKEPDTNSLSNMRRLATTVSAMFDAAEKKTLQDQLADAQSKVVAALKPLTDAKTDLDKATSTPNIEAAKTRVNRQIADVKARLDAQLAKDTALTSLVANLNTALAAVYTAVAKLAKTADDRLQPFKQNTTDPGELFNLFQNKAGDIPRLIQFDLDLQDSWTNLSAQLKNVVSDHDSKVTPADTAVKGLHSSVATVVSASNLNGQIGLLAKYAQTREGGILAMESAPTAHEDAFDAINESQRIADALDKINRIIGSISAQAAFAGISGFDKSKTQAAQTDLTNNVNSLRLRATKFRETLSGDRSAWVTEKIRLYYFTDIPRLVKTLNPTATLAGGDADARRRAEDRLEKLRAAEDAQSEANAAVSGLKRRVSTLRQELQQAKDELDTANFLAQASANRDAELLRRPAGSVSDERKALSAQEKNKREQDRAAAQERFDKANDEHTGLMAALKEAEAQLETAQAAVERTSNATIRAAQVESAAFANARDNAPFWYGPADATSTDPARRVEITSSTGGENAIFVRGRREDVVKLQDIIAELDEPAPQARMTLWKIELNSDATEKGADKFNKALQIVEQELADTRAKIATTLTVLLNAVNTEAEDASRTAPAPSSLRKDCFEQELYTRYFNPASSGLPVNTNITGRYQRLGRYSLYAPEVRRELGIEFIDELGFDNPKQFGLKDPGAATTLNEALIVLLLTDRDHRQKILASFRDGLTQLDRQRPKPPKKPTQFTRLESMLTEPAPRSPSDLETTRQQQELIYALRGSLLKHLVGRIVGLQDRVGDYQFLHKKVTNSLTSKDTMPDGLARLKLTSVEENALYTCLQEKLPKIFDTIHDEFPISAFDIMNRHVTLRDPGDGTIALQLGKNEKVYNLRPSPARVAAADGMLDVYTKAFEDDVDREFVQPMLKNLREKLKKTGIGFGVIQRTSMLATNRLVARVDPRATAELSVGEETNLIQGLQSISQIALAAQTGNVLGGLSQLKASGNEKDTAEIYGITSGSAFQVTPIFDPTGQALRFKFDFVDTTLVREPRGTTNPRIPRVERHTVNTEVQLANLEIREVSRFESDSKVGIPTKYWGGLPLVKDIPGIRPVPLIGWFVRRKGSNAIAQRSLIFAQTTMSPTIGDILDLSETSLQRR